MSTPIGQLPKTLYHAIPSMGIKSKTRTSKLEKLEQLVKTIENLQKESCAIKGRVNIEQIASLDARIEKCQKQACKFSKRLMGKTGEKVVGKQERLDKVITDLDEVKKKLDGFKKANNNESIKASQNNVALRMTALADFFKTARPNGAKRHADKLKKLDLPELCAARDLYQKFVALDERDAAGDKAHIARALIRPDEPGAKALALITGQQLTGATSFSEHVASISSARTGMVAKVTRDLVEQLFDAANKLESATKARQQERRAERGLLPEPSLSTIPEKE